MTGGGGVGASSALSRRGGVVGDDDNNDELTSPPRYDRAGFGTSTTVKNRRPQSPPVDSSVEDGEEEKRKGHGVNWPSAARRLILSVVHRLRDGRMMSSSGSRSGDRDLTMIGGGFCTLLLLLLYTLRSGGGGHNGIAVVDGGDLRLPPRPSTPLFYLPRRPRSVVARPPSEHMPPLVDRARHKPDYGLKDYSSTTGGELDGRGGGGGGGIPPGRRIFHRYSEGVSYVIHPHERHPTRVYFDDDSSNNMAGLDEGDANAGSGGYMRNFQTKRREQKRKKRKRGGECADTANKKRFHPTCNVVHGYSILDDGGWYKGKGAFREVIGFFSDDDDLRSGNRNGTVPSNSKFDRPVPFVMKIERSLKKKRDPDEIRQQIRVDAMVMETLTSSPAICDIYSHCGTTVVTERLYEEAEDIVIPGEWYMKHSDLNDSKDVDPQNEPPLTPTDKLRIAYEMAQGIASLHGNPGGVIVHDDHRLCQYLRDGTGRIKLNDFNRAEVMKWNEDEGGYCPYPNHGAWGNHRSPEEYRGKLLTEKIDVYSMGNNIYSLLTGLDVYYENEDDVVAQGFIKKGELPFIDDRYKSRSYAEGALVKILLRCWVYDPSERADIFEVLNFLREAVETNARLAAEGKTILNNT